MNRFRLTTVKNTMLIYVNPFRLCHQLLFGFVTVQNWKNNGKKPNMTIMFPFYNLFKHASVCLFSIYYEHRSKFDIPTAHWSRSPIVRQFDSPTEMCFFSHFHRTSKNSNKVNIVWRNLHSLRWRNSKLL